MKKSKKIFNLFRIYLNYIRRNSTLSYKPTKLWIETTNVCNLRCRLCPNKDIPKEQKGFMDWKLYKNIIDQSYNYLHEIYLFHRGESLLHPRIIDMIKYANSKNLKTVLHTNATVLNEELSKELIDAKLDFISFSFDGYDKEMYESNRTPAKFEKTLFKIIEFLKLKKNIGASLPYTKIQVMEYTNGYDKEKLKKQKELFLKNFEGLPVNEWVVRIPHNWGGSIPILENAEELKKMGFKYVPCPFLWYSLTIFYDGKVVPCPQDWFGKISIGDVRENSLVDIFNSEKLINLRETISNGDIENMIPCNSCDRVWRKTFLGVPTDYLLPFLKLSLE
ncbi:MAG: radical SAM/SPASM domain-containing protein [Candidatus Humimicrobiia bacterium]